MVFELSWKIVAVEVGCGDFGGSGDNIDGVKSSDGAVVSDNGWIGGIEKENAAGHEGLGFTEFVSSEKFLKVCPAFAEFIGVEVRYCFSFKVRNDQRRFLASFWRRSAGKERP